MKKFVAGLCTGLIIATAAVAYANPQEIKILVNGNYLKPPVPPQIVNGTTLVPLKVISQALGAEVIWDADSKTVKINTATDNTKPVENEPKNTEENQTNFTKNAVVNGDNLKISGLAEYSTAYSNELFGTIENTGTSGWLKGTLVADFYDSQGAVLETCEYPLPYFIAPDASSYFKLYPKHLSYDSVKFSLKAASDTLPAEPKIKITKAEMIRDGNKIQVKGVLEKEEIKDYVNVTVQTGLYKDGKLKEFNYTNVDYLNKKSGSTTFTININSTEEFERFDTKLFVWYNH